MKLLIVEDNEMMRQLIRRIVRDLADEILECADGDEALRGYRTFHPDWVLMDWQMPRIDGIAATREIIADFPDANICLVTNHDDDKLRREAEQAGASGFVLKDDLIAVRGVISS